MSYGSSYQNLSNALINSLVPPVTPKRQIVSVNGVQDAKNFNLDRGENIILMDSNSDVIYIKSVDELGKTLLKVFSCKDITDSVLNDSQITINKSDFDKLSKELSDLKDMVRGIKDEHNVSTKQSKSEKSSTEFCK